MNKKILIVTDFYEPHISGIVTYINKLINFFKNTNLEITVLTTKHDSNLEKISYLNKIKIIRCKPTIKISRGFFSLELISTFINIRKQFDYINVHLPLVEILPLVFFLNKKRTIINYHCLPEFPLYLKFVKLYFYFLGILAMINSKILIVLSKDYFYQFPFHSFFSKKLLELPPYINLPEIKNIKKTNDKKIFIGYLGRLCEEKGLEYLIRLSNHLISINVNHELIIAGDFKDSRFKKYINNLEKICKDNNNINFLGKINSLQKEKFFNRIDVFIFPSTNSFEAFGIVQLEAMSYGIPVVASNIRGVRSIIQNTKNGFLFRNKDMNDLIKKFIIFKEKNFDKNEIRKNLIKYYGKEIFKKKFSNLFKFF